MKHKRYYLPGQTFLIEVNNKGVIGCHQNIQPNIKFEVWRGRGEATVINAYIFFSVVSKSRE